MASKMIDLLMDFANGLNQLSPRKIDKMEVILPYDNYKQLEYELIDHYNYGEMLYGIPKTSLDVVTVCGIEFKISCKEINETMIQKKLQQCFKILSE